MMEQTKAKFLSWIKVRIGQPLTAIEIDEQRVYFGSISGYTGLYDLQTNKLHYFDQIDEQLIRGICSKDGKLYISIGDKHIRIKDLVRQNQNDEMLSVLRSHSNVVCSHSMTMMYDVKIVIFCSFPTQKRQALTVDLQLQNKNLYLLDAYKNQIKVNREFKMPQVAVPFDYDGQRILWMQYQQDSVKQFQYYDVYQKKVTPIKAFGKDFHFLSFGKLVKRQMIFIQNNKNVKCYHLDSQAQKDLYSHNSSVIAFNVIKRQSADYSLISVDFNGIFIQWKGNAIVKKFHLWDVKDVPKQIKKHQYLFDMGYAYYVKMFDNVLAISTDLGMLVYKL